MPRDFNHQNKLLKREVQYLLEALFTPEEQTSAKKAYEAFKQDGGINITITQINISC